MSSIINSPDRFRRASVSEDDILRAADLVNQGMSYTRAAGSIGLAKGCLLKGMMVRRGLISPDRKRESRPLILPTKPTDLAYIAGIIDGEGSICPLRKRSGRVTWVVVVFNTNIDLMDWLDTLGGMRHIRRPRSKSGKPASKVSSKKIQYGWVVSRKIDVLLLLLAVRPFLKIKSARLEEAIAYLDENGV